MCSPYQTNYEITHPVILLTFDLYANAYTMYDNMYDKKESKHKYYKTP